MAEKEFTMKQWALAYAKKGLAVFPVCAWGNSATDFKKPLTPRGCNDATTDTKQISTWWDKYPTANIGLAMGLISGGAFAIDLDVKEEKGIDGRQSLREWEREREKLPDNTWLSITGNGGYHMLYWTLQEPVGCRTNILEGVDIRGQGGYIVAPPSLHFSGRHYEWEQSPEDFTFMEASDIVLEFVSQNLKQEAGSGSFSVPAEIMDGERTMTLFKLVCSLQAKGLTDDAVKAAVQVENERRCCPPLTDKELEKEVFPALRRYEKGTNPYQGKDFSKRNQWGVQPSSKKVIKYTGADDLMEANLPPIVHLVQGLLTKGLGGLSAKSKLGKSWLALQLSVDLACGDKFLGFTSKQCGVLYIDLENTPALTQDRLRAILDGREPPENLLFAHDFNLMGDGFETDLVEFLEANPVVKLVIIDVFQKVKRGKQLNQTDYEADYEILTKLKQIADKYEICIMPIYHDRKFVDPSDPFSNLLGSTAIIGVSDFVWVLYKEKREDKEATLAVTGRTLIESSYKLKRNGVKWENLGNAEVVEETRKRREYEQDPVVSTIRKLVQQGNGKWRGRVKEIISSSQYFKGCRIYGTSQKVGGQIKARIEDLQEYDGIYHSEISKGTAASIHVFESENPFLEGEP